MKAGATSRATRACEVCGNGFPLAFRSNAAKTCSAKCARARKTKKARSSKKAKWAARYGYGLTFGELPTSKILEDALRGRSPDELDAMTAADWERYFAARAANRDRDLPRPRGRGKSGAPKK